MSLSYEYSIGSVRVKESFLFSSADRETLLACKNTAELIAFLRDKNYGDGNTVDEIIESNTKNMWSYIKSVAPDFSLFEPFALMNDAHNLKTVLKGIMAERDYSGLLMTPCTLSEEYLKSAVEDIRLDRLPQWLADAAKGAYKILAETKDARLSDAMIDNALMKELLSQAKKTDSIFIREYIECLVFYSNIKTAIRAAKTNAASHYLDVALCDMKGFDKCAMKAAALRGVDEVLNVAEKISAYHCSEAIEKYRQSPSEFEKYVDNLYIRLALELCRHRDEGPEPLLGYYIGCEYEHKMIYIIAGGIITGTPSDKLRERLRENYG